MYILHSISVKLPPGPSTKQTDLEPWGQCYECKYSIYLQSDAKHHMPLDVLCVSSRLLHAPTCIGKKSHRTGGWNLYNKATKVGVVFKGPASKLPMLPLATTLD